MKKIILSLSIVLLSITSFSQNAINFDGTNDLIQTTYSGVTGSADRTFEAWIKRSSSSTNLCILDYGLNAVYSRNTFYVSGSGSLGFISGGANMGSGSNTVPVGVWTHVAFVLNSGIGTLYINGAVVGSSNISNVNTPTTGTNLRIGNRVTGGNIRFKGSVDEVRVWNVARTQAEIAANMNVEFCSAPTSLKAYYKMNHGIAGGANTSVTTATDYSGGGFTGTLSNFALTGTASNWVTGKNIFPSTIVSSYTITACGSYTMPNGTIVTTSGTHFDTISSSVTCDSLDSYVITIASSIIQNVVADTGCIIYTTPLGNVITASGTYYDTISSSSCDTLIQYDIVISGAVDDSVYQTGNRLTSYDTWANHQWIDCNNGNAPIIGATSKDFNTTTSGNYAVIVTRGSCVDTSDCINVTYIGINENTINNLFEVFPNPTSSVISIKNIENKMIIGVSILDVSGKIILNQTTIENNAINIENLENGVYFLNVITEEGTSTIKFVKQ